jgi:hypothetical protein
MGKKSLARAILAGLTAIVLAPTPAAADLLSFCLSPKPTDPVQGNAWADQCPAYIQSQFASAIAAAQAQGLTTSLTQQQTQTAIATAQIGQQQTQAAILTALAGLSKPGAPAIPTGQSFDLSGVASAAQLKDAQLTYGVSKRIGGKIAPSLSAADKMLLVTPDELAALFSYPVDSMTIDAAFDSYIAKVTGITCAGAVKDPKGFAILPALDGLLGFQALLSATAGIATMFQPSLLAATKITPIVEPKYLLSAGLADGLGDKRQFLLVRGPTVGADNPILQKLGGLRRAMSEKQRAIAPCKADDPDQKAALALLKDVNDYIATLVKTDGTKPSLLDTAARRSALTGAGIRYTLMLSRDEAAGGVSAIKPNAFRSVQLLMGTSVGVSYQLVNLDGTPVLSGLETDIWSDRKAIDDWASADSISGTSGRAP